MEIKNIRQKIATPIEYKDASYVWRRCIKENRYSSFASSETFNTIKCAV